MFLNKKVNRKFKSASNWKRFNDSNKVFKINMYVKARIVKLKPQKTVNKFLLNFY